MLAELLQSRPNFLILDEPTNHMDIQAKETLESAFRAYQGTILFVSHDRYFISRVAKSILIFEIHSAMYYPFGYEHFLERREKEKEGLPAALRMKAEEQALIEGLKAVPKAERHRLREIPTEEAYDQWRLRLVAEALEEAGERAQLAAEKEWAKDWLREEETEEEEARTAWESWHRACMEWYEIWLEIHPERDENKQEEEIHNDII